MCASMGYDPYSAHIGRGTELKYIKSQQNSMVTATSDIGESIRTVTILIQE